MRTVTKSTSMMNHAIINALINIKYGIELIESENGGNQELIKRTQLIKNETEHLESIVNRLKTNLLQIEVVKRKAVDFSEIIDSCAESYAELCGDKNIQVVKRYPTPLPVDCDPIHFREVLSNLMKNAIEAVGRDGKIEIQAFIGGNQFSLNLTDTGCGIADVDLPHVTDPFITTKRSANHLGLGLTYCHSIIRKHGGELMIDSKLGKGTSIMITLPQVDSELKNH